MGATAMRFVDRTDKQSTTTDTLATRQSDGVGTRLEQ